MVLDLEAEINEFTDIPFREDSYIILFIGERGMGKSLSCAYYVSRNAEKSNRKVFYFPQSLKLSVGEPITIKELATFAELESDEPTRIDGSIIYVDEVHLVMNKYRSNTWGNRMVTAFLTQIRKRGCDFYATTNSPNQLDEALIDAIDFHGVCKKWTDKRCVEYSKLAGLEKPRHLADCKDTVRIRMADTKNKFGKSRRYADGIKRKHVTLHRVVNLYKGLYNTDATVSAIEISQLSKDTIIEASETAKTGTDFTDFVIVMQQQIIPAIVQAGGEFIYPNAFVKTLKEQFGIDASKERIGRACSELGLESKRGSKGSRYLLPKAEKLDLFVSGVG